MLATQATPSSALVTMPGRKSPSAWPDQSATATPTGHPTQPADRVDEPVVAYETDGHEQGGQAQRSRGRGGQPEPRVQPDEGGRPHD